MKWDDLRIFLAVHRSRTLSGAARELGVDATTVGRRLLQLESDLGTSLFRRTTDGFVLSGAGVSVVDDCQEVERRATRIVEVAGGRDSEVEGPVRLSVTGTFAQHFVIPRLAVLRSRHPSVVLHLAVSSTLADLGRGEADLALRFVPPGSGIPGPPSPTVDLKARRVGTIGVGVYTARSYLARVGGVARSDDTSGLDVVAFAGPQHVPGSAWLAAQTEARTALFVDSLPAQLAAVRAGIGIAALPCFVAHGDPELVRLPPYEVVDQRAMWLLWPGDLARLARVRAVWTFLTDMVEASAAMLGGGGDRAPSVAPPGGI